MTPSRLVDGIAARDEAEVTACFAEEAKLSLLTQSELCERHETAEIAASIPSWFADSRELVLVETIVKDVEGCSHIFYRFTGVEDGEP